MSGADDDLAPRPRMPRVAAALSPLAEHYFRALPGAGVLPAATSGLRRGEAAGQGVRVRFALAVDAGGVIRDARFEALGCPHVLAVCAWLSEQLPGRRLDGPLPGSPQEWLRHFDAPREKLGRLLVIEDAVLDCMGRSLQKAAE